MTKTKAQSLPAWVRNLRSLMEQQNFNPRSLSLKAGLNATAVRDMLEGRSQSPRYETVCALAETLNTTPAILMNDAKVVATAAKTDDYDLDLLTEIIARLQETTEEMNRKLKPRDFAAMTATLYRWIQTGEERKKNMTGLRPKIHDLLDYEMLRQKRGRS
jgi:transcriptional regulator with XRE-family HTH domain